MPTVLATVKRSRRFAPAAEIKIFESAWYKKSKTANVKPNLAKLIGSLVAPRVNLRSDLNAIPEKKSEPVIDRFKAAFKENPKALRSQLDKAFRPTHEREMRVWWDNEDTNDLIL